MTIRIVPLLLLCFVFSLFGESEKVLIYDEARGIIFVDKEEVGKKPKKEPAPKPKATPQPVTPAAKKSSDVSTIPPKPKAKTDLHTNRKKDGSDVYFSSGLKYYEAGSYTDALKNFRQASEIEIKPEYQLWMGKSYRQLGNTDQFLLIMKQITDDYPESDVADDALFETAFYHQKNLHFTDAIKAYTKLAEQYPFGLSYSNGSPFLEISRTERQRMRTDIISKLSSFGIKKENLEEGCTEYQTKRGLPVTKVADSLTVATLFAEYDVMLEEMTKSENRSKFFSDNLKFALSMSIISILVSFLMIRSLARNIRFKHEITLAHETINEMRIEQS